MTSRTVSRLRAGGGTTLTSTSRIELTSSPAATENSKRLIDRFHAAVELAPFHGSQRLGVFLAVGEPVGHPGRIGNPVSGPNLDRERERVAAGDLERRPRVAQGQVRLLGPAIAAPGNEQPPQGDSRLHGSRKRDHSRQTAAPRRPGSPLG